jgi:acyl dehydratase
VTPVSIDVAALPAFAGQEIGVSAWRSVDAATVSTFADVTGDHQWIHLDARRALTGPFGVPVAHGFLLLALIPALLDEVLRVNGVRHVLNKEAGPARFLAPVPVGDRVRGRLVLDSARGRPRGHWEAVYAVDLQSEKAAGVAVRTSVTYLYLAV